MFTFFTYVMFLNPFNLVQPMLAATLFNQQVQLDNSNLKTWAGKYVGT